MLLVLLAVKSVGKPAPKSLFCTPTCVPGLDNASCSACQKAIVDLLIRLKGSSKRTSGSSLSLGNQGKGWGGGGRGTAI